MGVLWPALRPLGRRGTPDGEGDMSRQHGLRGLLGGAFGLGGWLVISREAALLLTAGLVAVATVLVATLFFEAPSRRLRLLLREWRRR